MLVIAVLLMAGGGCSVMSNCFPAQFGVYLHASS